MGLYAVVENNLTLSQLKSRLQHIYHGQPYARVDFIPQSWAQESISSLAESIPVPEFIDPRFRENKPKALLYRH